MKLHVPPWILDGLAGLVLTGFVLIKLYPSWLNPSQYLVGTVYDNTWIYAFPTRLAYNLAHDLPLRAYETIGYPLPFLQRELMPALRFLVYLLTSLTSPVSAIFWLTFGALLVGGIGAYYLFRVLKLPWPTALIGGGGFTSLLALDTASGAGFLETGSMYFVSASLIPWFLSFLWQAVENREERSQLDTSRLEVLLSSLLFLQALVATFILGPWLGLGWWTVVVPFGVLGLNLGLVRWLKRQTAVPLREALMMITAVVIFNFILGLRIEMAYLLGVMAVLVLLVGLLSGVFERRRFIPVVVVGLIQTILSFWLPVYLLFIEPAGQGIGFQALENNRVPSLADLRNFSPGVDYFINRTEPLGLLALLAIVVGLICLRQKKLQFESRRLLTFGLIFLLGIFLTIKPEISIFGLEIKTLPFYLFQLGFQGLRRYGINHFSVFLFEWAAVASLLWLAFQGLGQRRLLSQRLLSLGLPSLILLLILIRFVPSSTIEVVHYKEAAEVYRWLKEQPAGAVIEYPLASVIDQVGQQPLFGQAYHRKPIINGLELKDYQLAVSLQKLDPYDRPLLQLLGVKYLVIHPQLYNQISNWLTTDAKIWYFPTVPPLDQTETDQPVSRALGPPGFESPEAFAEAYGLKFLRYFPEEAGFKSYVFEVPEGPGFGQIGDLRVQSVDLLSAYPRHPARLEAVLEQIVRIERPTVQSPVAGFIEIEPYLWGPSGNFFELYYSFDGQTFSRVDRRENGGITPHSIPQLYGLPIEFLEQGGYLKYRLLAEQEYPDHARLERLKLRWYFAADG